MCQVRTDHVMFVLVDIATMRGRRIVWSVDKALALPASNIQMIAELPSSYADAVVDKTISPALLFEGITRWATRND